METICNRKAYAEMLDWKNRLADKYALLVEGARRVGKTFLLRRFAKREYDSYIYIDFSHLIYPKITLKFRKVTE